VNEVFERLARSISEGLESVFVDWQATLLQFISTIILFLVIRRFFWKPITEFLENKQKAVNESLEHAKEMAREADEVKKKAELDYQVLKKETDELKERLVLEANKQKELIINEAKSEAKIRLEKVEKDIEFEIEEANLEIKNTIKEVAFAAAEKIVRREIDKSVHDDLLNGIIEEKLGNETR
jgi:F-type H+-transporting ATPase subunit b